VPDVNFPVDVPEPCTLFEREIDEWYRLAVARIPEFVDLSNPAMSDLETAWEAKSRLRFAGAMGLIDQDVAAEFLRDNPLVSVEELVALAKRTRPDEPLQEAARLLLNVRPAEASELMVVDNVSYANVVMPDGSGEMCVQTPDGWKTLHPVLPPRPVVPNPEYLPAIKPFYATATVWREVPLIGFHESTSDAPCALVLGDVMWLGYRTEDDRVALVEFSTYIEHQESRIGSLLVSHPYANAGLTRNAFNILSESLQTGYWSQFPARHWIVNFSDRTFDIVACSAQQIGEPVTGTSTLERVLEAARRALKEASE